MLNSGRKFCALPDKKKYILTRVVRKKIFERNKNHNPTLQVKWSVPKYALNNLFKHFLFLLNREII